MTISSYYLIGTLALVAIGIGLYQVLWRTRIRVQHLRIAIRASNDFYDRAEILLKDPATPEVLKLMIFDIGLAVSNEEDGRKASLLIMKTIADFHHRKRVAPRPRKELLDQLDQLRSSRGDLYDAFNEALSAAYAAILASYIFDFNLSKFGLSYDASSNRLSLAETLDHAISGSRDHYRHDHHVAIA
jgi:hypothetical protein